MVGIVHGTATEKGGMWSVASEAARSKESGATNGVAIRRVVEVRPSTTHGPRTLLEVRL